MTDTICLECGEAVPWPISPEGLCPHCLLTHPAGPPALEAGTVLGPYTIVSAPQSGAMGEVYKARDGRLDRVVAIKVLTRRGSVEDDARERGAAEARLIAGLNHPHICTIFDIGHHDGVDFLVMEFLEGETLADRLTRGALPLADVARYGAQIAAALSAVHRRGIVHHDVKPANIMMTRGGVKLLDFGVARLRGEMRPVAGGTPHYAAPEQLRGEPDDPRSDIYALGLVLAEMASQPLAPALARVVENCLHADADDRWQTAHDVALQLESIAPPDGARVPARRIAWLIAVAALAVIALAITAGRWTRAAGAGGQATRVQLGAPEASDVLPVAVISPNGRKLVWAITREWHASLWLQDLAEQEPSRLAGTTGAIAANPFWSPDSRKIGFFVEGRLKTIDTATGTINEVARAGLGSGGAWSRDGTIIFASDPTGPLYRVSAGGGTPQPVTTVDETRGETSHRWPAFLPDGRHFVYIAWGQTPEVRAAFVGSLDSPERVRLMPVDTGVLYAPPGYLLTRRGDVLLAIPFDARTLRITGEPIALASTATTAYDGEPAASVSANGQLTYTSLPPVDRRLTWVDRTGKSLGAIGPPGSYGMAALSPNGRRLVATRIDMRTYESDIVEIDLTNQSVKKMMPDRPVSNLYVAWAPDSEHLAYPSRTSAGPFEIVSGSMQEAKTDVLERSPGVLVPFDWSTDGRFLLCTSYDTTTKYDIEAIRIDGVNRARVPIVRTGFNEAGPRLSPDQQWMAFASDESGRVETYVQRFPNAAMKWQVSTGGGAHPAWRADGRELFFVSADLRLMAVSFAGRGVDFRPSPPQALFSLPADVRSNASPFAVTPDGQRFILVTPDRPSANPGRTFLVLNWPALLHQ
jgi:Tol biopolymer transport system component